MNRASRASLALPLVLVSLVLLIAPEVAVAGEFPVCTRTGNQTDPAISGSKVVFTDASPGSNHYQVFVYDIATKSEQAVSPAAWTQDWAAIDGNTVAYVYYLDGKLPWQVFSRDLGAGTAQPITATSNSQLNIRVANGVFVWTESNQIYRKRPSDIAPVALTTLAKSYESEDALALDGERVAFTCRNNVSGASHDLGVVSLSGGAITWLRVDPGKTLDASNPDVSGDRVVWQDNRNGNYDIYLYDFGTGQERRLTTAATNQTDPAISGDTVVYLDKTVNDAQSYVYACDIATGATRRLNSAGSAYEPDIDGDIAVWWDTRVPGTGGGDYNVYGYDLSVPDTFTKWTKRTSGTGEALLGVDFVSSKVGWVVGYGGTILKSTDAGATWKPQTSGTMVELTDIDMLDATTGWIVGYDRPNNAAVILKTANGGVTWTPQSHYAPVGSWMADVLAVDANKAIGFAGGVALGQNLVWTQDGGATAWATHPSAPAGTNLTGVSHLLSGLAWGVGAQSGLIKTTDSGATWAKVTHPTNGQERYTGVVALDANVAVVVGDDAPTTEATGLIMRTPDGGATWTKPTAPTTQQLREVDGKGSHLWIVGEGGTIYHSRDGGVTWGKQTSPVTAELWNIDYRGPDLICAVGLNGTILTGVRPTATLGRPVAPASFRRGAYFTVTGTLKPRHSGSTPLTFYRKKGGKWVKYKTVNAKNANYSTYTKYKLRYKVPYAGSWYVVASHSCTDHRASVSAREYFSVK